MGQEERGLWSTGEGEVCYALADSQASIQSLYTSTGSDRSVEGEDRHSNTTAANDNSQLTGLLTGLTTSTQTWHSQLIGV